MSTQARRFGGVNWVGWQRAVARRPGRQELPLTRDPEYRIILHWLSTATVVATGNERAVIARIGSEQGFY